MDLRFGLPTSVSQKTGMFLKVMRFPAAVSVPLRVLPDLARADTFAHPRRFTQMLSRTPKYPEVF
jgi:hypothetical protein